MQTLRARGPDSRARLSLEGKHFMRRVSVLAALTAGALVCSCRFIPTADVQTLAAGQSQDKPAFDPDKMVASDWTAKVVPYFEKKAGPFAEVRDLAAKSPDEAGARFGYRPKSGDSPWTLMVKLEGIVVEANTESRAATIGVDTTGKGKADATVQIGPALRGTSIRDALDFVSFNDFTNQIDFARYGKAFNLYADREILERLPRDSLVGRKVTAIGAYPLSSSGETPLVTPVEITLGPKP
jgi:predicted lipoprotein